MKVACILVCAALAALDQAVKAAVRRTPHGTVIFELPGLLRVTHRANTGAAFSLFSGRTTMLALVSATLLALLFVLMLRRMHTSRAAKLSLAVLAGGGIGNLVDRALFGSVTDYVQLLFIDFPVFNLADVCITCAVAALLALTLTGRLEEA